MVDMIVNNCKTRVQIELNMEEVISSTNIYISGSEKSYVQTLNHRFEEIKLKC